MINGERETIVRYGYCQRGTENDYVFLLEQRCTRRTTVSYMKAMIVFT